MRSETARYTESWLLSLFGHGAIVALSIAFVSALQPVPERNPFRWDVSLVDVSAPTAQSPAAAAAQQAEPSTSEPPPVKHATPRRTPTEPIEQRAVVQPTTTTA